jgi:hypothetical protein
MLMVHDFYFFSQYIFCSEGKQRHSCGKRQSSRLPKETVIQEPILQNSRHANDNYQIRDERLTLSNILLNIY